MKEWMNQKRSRLYMILMMCLTLGLAPFTPEPHLWMDLKWVWSGGSGMTLMNWFDLFLHGAPWIWLLVHLISWYINYHKLKSEKS